MFERILFPTDFSGASLTAVDYLKRLVSAGAREVIVLHVIDAATLTPTDTGVLGSVGGLPWIDEIRRSSEHACAEIVGELRGHGLQASSLVTLGDPAAETLAAALEHDVSLIVIGSRGKGHLAELVLGSVSEAVIRKADRPVLVVKP